MQLNAFERSPQILKYLSLMAHNWVEIGVHFEDIEEQAQRLPNDLPDPVIRHREEEAPLMVTRVCLSGISAFTKDRCNSLRRKRVPFRELRRIQT
jgi:hypothetical protein